MGNFKDSVFLCSIERFVGNGIEKYNIDFIYNAIATFITSTVNEKSGTKSKKRSQICEYQNIVVYLHPQYGIAMIVTFEKDYLRELYENGQASDKKHRFQPQIVKKYTRVVDLMMEQANVVDLARYGGLHYEHLHGDKEGLSTVRVNDQYRIEFREILEGEKTIAEVVNIIELSNHYK